MSERVCTDGWVPGEIWERVLQTLGRQLKRPAARKCWVGSEVLQAVDLTVGGTQVLPSVDTGGRNAVARHIRRCAAVQTPVNCHCQLEKHPVGGRRTSEVRHAASDPDRGQTSKSRVTAFSTRCNISANFSTSGGHLPRNLLRCMSSRRLVSTTVTSFSPGLRSQTPASCNDC